MSTIPRVDEHRIDATELRLNPIRHALLNRDDAGVGRHADHATPEIAERPLDARLAVACDRNARAFGEKPLRRCEPDSARAARDQRPFALEPIHCHFSVSEPFDGS